MPALFMPALGLRLLKSSILRLMVVLSLAPLLVGSVSPTESQQPEPEVARLWTGGMTPQRVNYEAAIIDLALQISADRYGPYELVLDTSPHSPERALRELRSGEHIHMASAPIWGINLGPEPPMIIVHVPLARGLMGYRRLVVRREEVERFTQIKIVHELQEKVAGLGYGWIDTDIFKQGGFKVTEGENVDQLYTMLVRERFDYFPLGSMEVDESLAASEHRDQLSIVPNLVIYYPLPIHVQVSRERPGLAERLEYGLSRAQESGAITALFDQYYGNLVSELRAMDTRIVVLDNQILPENVISSGPELLPGAERLPNAAD